MPRDPISPAAIKEVLRAYWSQYRALPLYTFGAFTLPAVGTIFVFFVPPLIIAEIVNLIAKGEQVTLPLVSGYIAMYGGLWLLGEALWRVGMHFLIQVEKKGKGDLAKDAFASLLMRDYDFYANNFVGSLTKKTLAYASRFENFSDVVAFNALTNLLPILFAIVVLWQYSPWLPSILIVSIALVIAIAIPIIRRRSRLVALRHATGSRVSGSLSDALTNVLAIKSFATEEREKHAYEKDLTAYINAFEKAANYQNVRLDLVLSPLYVATNVLGLVVTIFLAEHLGLTAGTIVVVFSYYALITRTFWEINHIYRNIENSLTEAAEFTELMLARPKVLDAPHAQTLSVSDARIDFNNVYFGYAHGETTPLFLENFNLSLLGGERVGLVGPSGGGKTTITKLLMRFVDLSGGSILIDGQNIAGVTQQSLRRSVAYVPQEPLLFHRSLFENIAYGNTQATPEEVFRSATLAHADEFIRRLPQGYDTLVGERGVKLSGGQRQRVAIARAILKNAPILVLDEATSSLDSESEKYIQEGLWELMKNKTAIVIAHRLSTIKHCDRIIVLDQGTIAQDGTHDELVALEGLYKTLWSHQSGGFIED